MLSRTEDSSAKHLVFAGLKTDGHPRRYITNVWPLIFSGQKGKNMGTNYFFLTGKNRIHVGKQSCGWSFGFRAYTTDSPFDFPVISVESWRMAFLEFRGKLITEYKEVIANPVDWLDNLNPPDRTQILWELNHTTTRLLNPKREWRDGLGFRFYDGEFC